MILIVDNQSVYPYSRGEQIADGSVGFVKIEFRPSREWDGYLMHAQFRQGLNVYTVPFDENNSVFLPSEITAGEVEISVFGYAEGRPNRGTSIPYTQTVFQSGFTSESSIPIPPTPDLYTQLLKGIDSAVTRAEDAAKRAEEIAEAMAGGGSGGDIDSGLFLPSVKEEDNGKVLTVVNGRWAAEPPESGVQFETDETLTLEDGTLRVNTADKVEEDNTLPVTSAAVYTEVGNINALLATI